MNRDRWLGAVLGSLAMFALIYIISCARPEPSVEPAAPVVGITCTPYASPTAAYPLPRTPVAPRPTALGVPGGYPYPGPGGATPSPTPTRPTPTTPERATPRPWHLPLITRGYVMVTRTPTATPTHTPTPTPTATPTPTPIPWPEPLDAPGPSKLGLHVQWNNSPDILEFVKRFRPAVVKGVNDLNFLAEVKALSPTTVTIGRIEDGSPSRDQDAAAAARDYVNRYLGTYLAHPWIDYWEGINEPDVGNDIAWYAAFEAERARRMADHGLRVAIGSFSTGVPEWEAFGAFLPAVEAAKAHGGILSLHEYDAPTMTRSVGSGLPGRQGLADRGALLLRYRWWYEDYLKPRGLVVPLAITEAGVDGGVTNRPGPEGGGWRDFTGYWAGQGLGHDGVAEYMRQLAWYDAELRKDDYVIGCAIFTAGAMGEDWESFDITGILRQIGRYMVDEAYRAGMVR
jgi:hypothetical protein